MKYGIVGALLILFRWNLTTTLGRCYYKSQSMDAIFIFIV